MKRWILRARHAWTVGLDGPWPTRLVVRLAYTFGLAHSPTFSVQVEALRARRRRY